MSWRHGRRECGKRGREGMDGGLSSHSINRLFVSQRSFIYGPLRFILFHPFFSHKLLYTHFIMSQTSR